MEFFTNCKDVFGIYTASKPQRNVSRLVAKQCFGDGLAGTAGDSFDFRIEQNAGLAALAQGCDVIEVGGFADACGCIAGEGVGCVGGCRYAVELNRIEDTFAGELDGGLAFGGFRIGNDADEEGGSFDALRLLRMTCKVPRARNDRESLLHSNSRDFLLDQELFNRSKFLMRLNCFLV